METEAVCSRCKKPNSDPKHKYCFRCREKERIKKSRSRSRSKSRSPSPVRQKSSSKKKEEDTQSEDISLLQIPQIPLDDSKRAELEKELCQLIRRLFMSSAYFQEEIPTSFWTLENIVEFLDRFASNTGWESSTQWDWSNITETISVNTLRKMRILGFEKYSRKKELFSKPAKQWTMRDLNLFFKRFYDPKEYKCDCDPKLVEITGEQYFYGNFNDLRYFCIFQHPLSGEHTDPILILSDFLERNPQYNKKLHEYTTLRDKKCKEWDEFENMEAEQKRMEEEERRLKKRKALQAQADEINAKRRGKHAEKKKEKKNDSNSEEIVFKAIDGDERLEKKKSAMKSDIKEKSEGESEEDQEVQQFLKKKVSEFF